MDVRDILLTIKTTDGDQLELGSVVSPDLCITTREDRFCITHRHTGYLVTAFYSLQDAMTVAVCIKALDWDWNIPEKMPTETRQAACLIFGYLRGYIKFATPMALE